MIAPPWLTVPPVGYGATEILVYDLARELKKNDIDVEVFSIAASRIRGVKLHSYYNDEQYEHIHKALYEASPIPIAQELFALEAIAKDGSFDIIHDHNYYVGPLALSWATRLPDMPPALHTNHGPPFSNQQTLALGQPDNLPLWRQIGNAKRLYIVGVSNSLMKPAPQELSKRVLPAVYNSVNLNVFPYQPKKQNHFITLGRFARDKGQHIAAQLCDEMGYKLEMAGTVAGINTPRQLLLELSDPLSPYRGFADFRYYSDNILPLTVKNPRIRYVGNINLKRKIRFVANAKALLFPIDWEEPFGIVAIEALACGTPVVAMKRGALPEIIEHGVNGFLAKNVKDFAKYMQRVGEIDPAACRKTVEEKFSTPIMTKNYIDRYRKVLELDGRIRQT